MSKTFDLATGCRDASLWAVSAGRKSSFDRGASVSLMNAEVEPQSAFGRGLAFIGRNGRLRRIAMEQLAESALRHVSLKKFA